jgi:hypothetical protein
LITVFAFISPVSKWRNISFRRAAIAGLSRSLPLRLGSLLAIILLNTHAAWAGAPGGGALHLNGGSGSYAIASPFNSFPAGDFTVELWMRSGDTSNDGTPISYATSDGGAGFNDFILYNYRNLDPVIRAVDNYSGVAVNDGSWHHLAVTWQQNSGALRLYRDGTLVSYPTVAPGYVFMPGGALVLGQEQDGLGSGFSSSQAFTGDYDEVRLWNKVRSQSDILGSMYDDVLANRSGLVAYYQFNQSGGGIATNSIDGGTDLSLVGTLWTNVPPAITNFVAVIDPLWNAIAETFSNSVSATVPEYNAAWVSPPGGSALWHGNADAVVVLRSPTENFPKLTVLQGSNGGGSLIGSSSSGSFSFVARNGVDYVIMATNTSGYSIAVPIDAWSYQIPANDDQARAFWLSNTLSISNYPVGNLLAPVQQIEFSTNGYTQGATAELWEGGVNHTVWYRWTAPAVGVLDLRLLGTSVSYLELGLGTNGFTSLAGNATAITYGVTNGQEYLIRVRAAGTTDSTFTLNLRFVPKPANDDFANPDLLLGTPGTLTFDMGDGLTWQQTKFLQTNTACIYAATKEAGENYTERNTLWYQFSPAQRGLLRIPGVAARMFGGNPSASIWLGTGDSAAATYQTNKVGIYSSISPGLLASYVEAGVPYRVRLATEWNNFPADQVLSVWPAFYPGPVNDDFENRTPVTSFSARTNWITWEGQTFLHYIEDRAIVLGTTLGARRAGTGETSRNGEDDNVWWSLILDRPQPLTLSTLGSLTEEGLEQDTYVYVFTETGGSFTQISANNNGPGTLTSLCSFTPSPGTEYKLMVCTASGSISPGPLKLTLTQPRLHSNDAFTNAIGLMPEVTTLPDGSRSEAVTVYQGIYDPTSEPGEADGGLPSLWFTWTPSVTGNAYFYTSDSTPSSTPSAWAYTGTNVTSLSRVSSGWTWTYDSTRIVSTAAVTAGTTYRIALRGGGGIAKLQIQVKGAPAVISNNDNRSDAMRVIPETVNIVRDGRMAVLSGNAGQATSEMGESNLLDSIHAPNDSYAANSGTNTLWWSFTTSSNSSQISVCTYALVADIPMRTGLGADAFLNLANPYGNSIDLMGIGVVAGPDYADFTSPVAGGLRLNRVYGGNQARVELYYTYVTNTADAYNGVLTTTTGSSRWLAVRNADHMLGYYNNAFVPLNFVVQPGRDYYLAVEVAGSRMAVWVDGVMLGNNLPIYEAGNYWVQWIGQDGGGYFHDLRIYEGVPVAHEAIAVWSGNRLLAVDDDAVTVTTTPNSTYLIQAAPLSGQTNVLLRLNEFYAVPNDDHASATILDLTPQIQTFDLPNGQVLVTNAAAAVTGSNAGATRAGSEYSWNAPIGASVWFRFTAPMNGTVMFDPGGSAIDTVLELESVSQWDSAARSPLAATEGAMTYSVTAGATYYLKLDGHNWGNYALKVYYVLAAPNDGFYAPTTLSCQTNVVPYVLPDGTTYITNYVCRTVGHTFYANLDRGDENCPSDNSGYNNGAAHLAAPSTIWWMFTAPSDGNITVDARGSSAYTYVGIGTPSYPYFGMGAWGSNVITMRVTKGVSYRIEAAQSAAVFGAAVNLSINLTANPANDGFYSPTPVMLQTNATGYDLPNGTVYLTNYSAAVVGNTFAASLDRGDENCPSDNNSYNNGAHAAVPCTIWWTITAPDNGLLTLDATGSTAMVYLGIGTPSYPYFGMGAFGSNVITMRVNKDVTYRIEAAQSGNAPDGAAINLRLSLVALNPNDGFYATASLIFQPTNSTAFPLPNGTAYVSNYVAATVGHTFSASIDRNDEICPSDNLNYNSGTHAAAPQTVWWSFIAPASGRLFINTVGSSAYTYVAVGTPSYQYMPMAAFGSNAVSLLVAKDASYRVLVAPTNSSSGAFVNLTALLQAADLSDNFPGTLVWFNATTNYSSFAEFGFTNVTYSGRVATHNFGATLQSGNENFSSYLSGIAPANQTLWWQIIAPASGTASVSTEGTALDTLLRFTTVSSVNNYGAVFINDDANGGMQSSGQAYLDAGSAYKVELDTKAGSEGPINLTIVQAVGPDNDQWGRWTTITETPGHNDGYQNYSFARVPGDTSQATSQGEDFQNGRGLSVTPTRNVWYRFTSATAGYVRLTLDSPTLAKPALGIYTGWNSGWQGGSLTGDLWFYANANTTYYFVIEGADHPGPFALNLYHYTDSVPNDSFVNRIALTNGIPASGISAGGATREGGETSYYGSWGSVWYSYVADCSGLVEIDTDGSEADTVLGIFTGTAVNGLSPVASSDNVDGGVSSRVYFVATQGTDYKVQLMFKNVGKFRITARSLCSQVSALPSQGTFNQAVPVRLFAMGSPMYYSTNGAPYQIYAPPLPTYTNIVGCTSDGSGIVTKTNGGSGTWNSGFISAQSFTGDGYVEMVAFTLSESMFGLDAVDNGVNWPDIDYGLCPRTSGNIDIFEAGAQKAYNAASYSPGDLLRVQRVGQVVQFLKNGVVFFTSTTPSTGPVHLDASLSTQGAPVGQFTIASGTGANSPLSLDGGDASGSATLSAFVPGGNTNTWNYRFKAPVPCLTPGNLINWSNPTGGIQVVGSTLWKSAGGSAWNANAMSVETVADDGALEFVVITNHLMIGLDRETTNSSYTDIDYAFHTYADGSGQNLAVYENGNRNYLLNGVVQMGDLLRIERQGSVVRYYQNGQLRYTSSIPSTGPLHVDACIYYPGYPAGPVFLQNGLASELRALSMVGNTTRFSQAPLPAEAPGVQETDAVFPEVLTSAIPVNIHARNYRPGYQPSEEARRNLGSLAQTLSPLVFNLESTNFFAPANLSVLDPQGRPGVITITYPDGSLLYAYTTNGAASFPDRGSGKYSASLAITGLGTTPPSSTNLNFQVNALKIMPASQAFSTAPLVITAETTYTVNVFYSFTSSGLPNIRYTNPLAVGASNATVRFMATRVGYASQFVTNSYVYSPDLIVIPSGTFSNATTFRIQGGSDRKFYQAGNGGWQSYSGPFILDGISGGGGSIRAYFEIEPGTFSLTNVTPIIFKVANPEISPASGAVTGDYSITMTSATENATIYYALKDPAAGPIALPEVTNVYSHPLQASNSANLLTIARKANYLDSASMSASYLAKLLTPVFLTPSTNSAGPLTIVVGSRDTSGGAFRLTQPGGQVQTKTTTNSAATFVVNESGVYTLVLQRSGWIDSDPVTCSFLFSSDDVVLNPASGCLYNLTNATLVWNNGNPKVPKAFYTLDGSVPTTNSNPYTVGVSIPGSVTLTILVTRDGYAPRFLTNQYVYLPPVDISPLPGTNHAAIEISLAASQASSIYYQINRGPWLPYVSPFGLDGSGSGTVLVGTRYDTTGCPGSTNQVAFVFKTLPPDVQPSSTNFTAPVTITVTEPTPDAVVFFEQGDGYGGNVTGIGLTNIYSGPILVTSTRQFVFEAHKAGYQNSVKVTNTYSSPLPPPVFLTGAGTFTGPLNITVQSGLAGTSQSFVLTSPTGSRSTNNVGGSTGSFVINESGDYQLQAFKPNWQPSPVARTNYAFAVGDLQVLPSSQLFSDPFTVTASQSSNPKPLLIYYTVDGSLPTTNSFFYTNAITVSNTVTLRFLGWRQGYAPQYVERTYTYAPGLAISPLSGTNSAALVVTMVPYLTNSTIYYAVNDNDWSTYRAPFLIDGAADGVATVRAYAVTGPTISPTNTVIYTFKVAALAVDPANQALSGPLLVTATTTTPGAQIFYALGNEGGETPGPVATTNLYTMPISVNETRALRFEGRKAGYQSSDPITRIYSARLPKPSFVTASDTFSNQKVITVRSGLAGYGASFALHTPSGAILNTSSASDTAVFTINESGNYQLTADKANWLDSEVADRSYFFVVGDLKVNPVGGTFGASNLTITAQGSISNPRPLRIYYTTDASQPTTNSMVYIEPISITNTTTIKWLAVRDYYSPQYATNAYTWVPGITLSPPAGVFSNATTFSVSTLAPNARLFFSTNASDWHEYTTPLILDGFNAGVGTLRATYTNAGGFSPTQSFTITFAAAAPQVTPTNSTIASNVLVTATTATAGAQLYYSLSATGFDEANPSNLYASPLVITHRSFIAFQARKEGYQSSGLVQRKYIQKLPSPVLLTTGNFTNWVSAFVELPEAVAGVSFVVQHPALTNELRPAPVSPATGKPLGSFVANATGSYSVRATATDWEDSESITNELGFYVRDLATPEDQKFNTPVFQVMAESSLFPVNPKPLQVFFTTDGSLPDTNSTLYSDLVSITGTTTLRWLAQRAGYYPQTRTNTYTYVPPLTVVPPPGTYSNAIAISLGSPHGEAIFYSVNRGPWLSYSEPLAFDGYPGGILDLQAIYTGGATNFFFYRFQVDPPQVTPDSQTLDSGPIALSAVNGNTRDATLVYYEGDLGGGAATTNRPMINYTGPIPIAASRSYLFQARKTNYFPSLLVGRVFTSQLPAPVVTAPNGPFTAPVSVQIQSGLPGYGGEYLMIAPDGSTNRITTEAPSVYFQANASGTYRFQMARAGWLDSDTTNWSATFNVADLQVTPPGGLLSVPDSPVTAKGGPNPKPLRIYYTLDGSFPTTNSSVYVQPLRINQDTTIIWLAERDGYYPAIQTNSYVFVAGAAISPIAAFYTNATTFTLSALGPSDGIFYRTNADAWIRYTGPFNLDGSTDIAFYSRLGTKTSTTNLYRAGFKVGPVAISPQSCVFTNAFTISASEGTLGAAIFYLRGDEDGSAPPRSFNGATNAYSSNIAQTADNSAYYIFTAAKPGYTNADWVDRSYTARLPLPTSVLETNLQIAAPTINTLTFFRPARLRCWTNSISNGQWLNSSEQPFVNVTYIHPGTYWYRASRHGWADSEDLPVSISLKHPDDFADGLELALLSAGTNYDNGQAPQTYGALGDLGGATRESGEWDGTFDDNGSVSTDAERVTSLWYRWRAPANGLAQIKVFNNQTGQTDYFIYGVYTGNSLPELTPVTLARVPTEFSVQEGTQFAIAINSGLTPGQGSEFQVQLEFYPAPRNDAWSNAIPIQGGQVYSAYTHAATSEPGELHGQSTWWLFTTLQPGTLEVPLSARVEATLWQGTAVSNLNQIRPQYHTSVDYHFPPITTNNYFFVLPAAGTYQLRIAGENAIYSFAPKFHLPPAHDHFPATVRLPAGVEEQQDNYLLSAVSYDSTTLGATLQASEPPTPWPTTVWYQWTAPESGDLDISVGQLFLFSTPGFGTTLTSWQSQPVDFLNVRAFTGNNFSDLAELPHLDNKDSFSSLTLMPDFETEDPAVNSTVAGAPVADTYTALFTGNVAYTTYREGWWRWRAQFNGDAYLTKITSPPGASFSIDAFTGDRYEDLLPQYLYSHYAGDSEIAPQSYFHATMDQIYTFHAQFGSRPATNATYSFKVEPEALSRASVSKGQLVYFRVDGLGSPHRIKLNLTSRARNDDFQEAMDIPLQLVTYENGKKALGSTKGRLVGATAESFESNGVHSVWYRIASPISGHGRARLTGNYSTFVDVYSGSNPTNLTALDPENFPITPGSQYYIRVYDLSIQNYTLNVVLAEHPVNDLLVDALPLQRSNFKAYTDHATVESGEPIKQQSIGESVWWRYAPSLDGTMVIGSSEKTAYLWQGTNLFQLNELANNLGGDIIQPLGRNQEYRLSFDTRPGLLEGDFNALAAYYVLPANDDFINAAEITAHQNSTFDNGVLYTYSQHGYTYGATVQLNEPAAHQRSVWYRWTAPTNLIVYVACERQTYIYTGENVSALNPIGERVFSAVAGQTYQIAVCGGPSEFTLTLNGALPAYNDHFALAMSLPGTNAASFYTYASSVETVDQPTTNSYSVWWTWRSGNSTNLYLYPDTRHGPDDPVQGQYPQFFASEIRVTDAAGRIVGQGFVSFEHPYLDDWSGARYVLPVSIQPSSDYHIAVLSPYPTRGWLRLSEKPLPTGCPLGSECNPAMPLWTLEDSYVNGDIFKSYLLAYGNEAPDPYWFFTRFPRFSVGRDGFGYPVTDPQGWLTSSSTNILFRLDGSDTPYSPYMSALAGNDSDTVRITTHGENTGVTLRDVHVPRNDSREGAIFPPLLINGTPSFSFTTYDSASRRSLWRTYNEMASTEGDGFSSSVWYLLRIPAPGRLAIGNQTASTLQLIPVNATAEQMTDTNIGVHDYSGELLPAGTATYPAMTEPVINFRGKSPVNNSNYRYREELTWISPFTGRAFATVNQSNLTVTTAYAVTQSSSTAQSIVFSAERGRAYTFGVEANYNLGGTSFQLSPEIPTAIPTSPLGQPITLGPYGASTSSREVAVDSGFYYVVQYGDWSAGAIDADFYASLSNDDFANAAPLTDWQLTRYGNGRIYSLAYRCKLGSATLEVGEPPPATGDRTLWYSFIAPMSGQLQFQGWANIYSGESLSNLTLLSHNDPYTRQPLYVTGGNVYYIQNSGSFGGGNSGSDSAITLIEPPSNDFFNAAVPVVTNYNTITNIGGTNYYLYEFTVPAGFWPAVQDDQGRNFYLRNWYRIESEDLADIWVYGWNDTFDGAVTSPGKHSYADVNMDLPVALPNGDPYATTILVTPEARSEIFPGVWGKTAYDIHVPWTWNYAAHQQLATVITNGDSLYDVTYAGIKDARYKGLFDLSVFSIGEKLSYLYAVPGNLVVRSGGQDLRTRYVFVLRKPTSVKLTPVFPVGRQAAAEGIEVKSQRLQLNTTVYNFLSTLEGGEPSKPGTAGGSVWWTLEAPFTGFLRINASGAYNGGSWYPTPLIYIWEGATLSTLHLLASNYSTASVLGHEVIASVIGGQKLWVSADRQDDGGVFSFAVTLEPRPPNQDPEHATQLVGQRRAFENGTNWAYATPFTIYPIGGDYTNNDLWFKFTAPAAARLSADDNANLLTLYTTLKHDLRITPPGRDYLGSLALSMDTDDPAVIYYTVDGSPPTPGSPAYRGSFEITNSLTVRAVAYRTNRTEVYASETYVYHAPLSYVPPPATNSSPYLLDLNDPDNDGATILFRIEGGEWQVYTGPTNLDGLGDLGQGYVYFTRVFNGHTNPVQYVHLNFQLPLPLLDITNAIIPYTNASLTISLTNVPPGATAVWVGDGTDHPLVPDSDDARIWHFQLPISQANIYHFRFTKPGYQPSPIAEGIYTAETIPPPPPPTLFPLAGGTHPSVTFSVAGVGSDSVLQVRYSQFLNSAPPISGGTILPASVTSYSPLPGEEYRLLNPAWFVSSSGAFNEDLFNHTWDTTRVDTFNPSNGTVQVTLPWGSQGQIVLIRSIWGRSAASSPVTIPVTWKMPQPAYNTRTNQPAFWNGTNYVEYYYDLQPAFRLGALHVTFNSPIGLPQLDDAFVPTLYTRIYGVFVDTRGPTNLVYATDPYHDHDPQRADTSTFASFVQSPIIGDYGLWSYWTDRYAIEVNAPNDRPPGYSPPWDKMANYANVMSLFDGWVSHGLTRITTDYLYPDMAYARSKPIIHVNTAGSAVIVQIPVYANLPGRFTPVGIEPSDPLVITP